MTRSLLVLGGSGDLTGRYLLPSLAHLVGIGALGADVEVRAVSREEWDDEDYRAWARERLARFAKAEPTALQWDKQAGPFFGNQIGELVLEGREARFLLSVSERGDDALRQVLDAPLSDA